MNKDHDDSLRVGGAAIFLNLTCAKSDIKNRIRIKEKCAQVKVPKMSSTFWNDDTNDVTHLLNLSAPVELDKL